MTMPQSTFFPPAITLTGDFVQYSTITSWARLVWAGLTSYGLNADAVFEEVGLDPAALGDPDARYPLPAMFRLWGPAEERTQDPCFGLTAASSWHPTTAHALGYAWLASRTLEEAMRRFERYSAIISTVSHVRFAECHNGFKLTISSRDPRFTPPGVVMDAGLATVVHMCRATYGRGFKPLRVTFTHEGRGCRQKRHEIFGSPIHYGAADNALYFGKTEIYEPLSTANAVLARANDNIIRDYLARLDEASIVARLKAQLIERLPSGSVTEKTIAKSLHMSLRTLQRKLAEADISYKQILQETRRELAEQYIQDSRLSLNEITYLLGFSEISSFSRSFKRWTGAAPRAYRESL